MNFYFISYATDNFLNCQNHCHSFVGNEKFIHKKYNYSDLEDAFCNKNKHILKEKRGAGYWVWKPYLILKTMSLASDGDVIVYCDVGDFIYNDIYDFINHKIKKDSKIIFLNIHKHSNWCKKYCLEKMNCLDNKYFEINQVEAGFCIFQNNDENKTFINDWLNFCEQKDLIDDSNISDEIPSFMDHRHDQAILTNLVFKNNIQTVPIQEIYPYITYNYCKP